MGEYDNTTRQGSDPVRDLGLPLPIILGSGSLTRKLILGQMNINFFVHVKPIDEKSIGERSHGSSPEELVLTVAKAKAVNLIRALLDEDKEILSTLSRSRLRNVHDASMDDGFIILTADQVVTHNGSILEKPESHEQAIEFVQKYAMHPPATVGSVVLTHLPSQCQVSGIDVSTIYFKPTIANCDLVPRLLGDGAPVMNCAGGLMIEHPWVQEHVEKIDGSIDGVMGLSKSLVLRLLRDMKRDLGY